MLHATAFSPRGHTSSLSFPKEFYERVLEIKKYACVIQGQDLYDQTH